MGIVEGEIASGCYLLILEGLGRSVGETCLVKENKIKEISVHIETHTSDRLQ